MVRKSPSNDSLKQKWRDYYKGDVTELWPTKDAYLQVTLLCLWKWTKPDLITKQSQICALWESAPSIFRYAVTTSCNVLIVSNIIDSHNFSLDDVLQTLLKEN